MLRLGTIRGLAILGLAFLIPACGGGGSGGGGPVPDSVQFSAATYTVNEADGSGKITITVTRTKGAGAVSVNYATSNGTATAGTDYTATSGTLSWLAGDSVAKTFDVTVNPDAAPAVEGDETVLLALSLPSGGAALGTQKTATIILNDADAPADGVFQFSAASYTISEAAATVQATITVTRTGGSTGAVIANVTTSDGTAISTIDYTTPAPNPVVLNWADGDAAAKTFTIDVLNTASAGAAVRTVNLVLSVPVQAPQVPVVGTLAAAVLNIIDHDVPGTVRLGAATDSIFESGGLATITVSRINGTGGAASVEATVAAGSAVAGTHFTVPTPNPVVLNWADGDFADKTFTIAVIDNMIIDGTRTLTVTLGTPVGVATSAPAVETLSILDDEPGNVAFKAATFSIAEGGAATILTITATRTGGSLGAASVDVVDAGGGSATSAGDYAAIGTATLNWANGVGGDKTFDITINGDATVETDETINLLLQNPLGTVLGVQTTAVATILNDDVPTNGSFQFDPVGVYTVLETAGTIDISVQRTGGTVGAVQVTVTTSNGTAKSNGNPATRDFVSKTQNLMWANGDGTAKTFTVTINRNTTVDAASEVFNVTMSAPTGGATLTGSNPKQVTITDVP